MWATVRFIQVQQEVYKKGLRDKVIFAGVRSDIPRLMMGAMDAFVMPSLYEGLPLVGMEAQAAGLPLIISDVVTEEAIIVEPLVCRLSLSQPPSVWAEETIKMQNSRQVIRRIDAIAEVGRSKFNIKYGVSHLEKIYLPGAHTDPKPFTRLGQRRTIS